jgi:multicomponent Na+:H+ antiporter subunit E
MTGTPAETTPEVATDETGEEADEADPGVRKWPVVGAVLAVLWVFVRGVEGAPDPLLGEFVIGLLVGLPVAYATRRFYLDRIRVGRALRAGPMAAYYVALFLWELLTANVDVAYRVLWPSMPIEPDVVAIPLRVETDAAVTTVANSITLTPGTLTMDHDDDTNTLFVHGIVGQRRDAIVGPIRRWEDLLLVVFEEDADPGDPVDSYERRRAALREDDAAAADAGPGGDADGD